MLDLPVQAGIGLRAPHIAEILAGLPEIAWLEVHSENYFASGGAALGMLETVREHYPLSLHGVGLSLGSTDPLNRNHLRKLKALIERVQPMAVSEHLCWSSVGGRFLNDLLPLPYTEEALLTVCERIRQAQDFLGRRIMVENVSSYVRFSGATMPEWEFLAEVAQRSDCGILLDVNNIHVSAANHGFSALDYLDAIPARRIGEIHLAGYETDEGELADEDFLVDTHSRPVSAPVWDLYVEALRRFGPRPTLIEWDNDIPELAVLLAEARTAQKLLATASERSHACAA